jgi:hypothetical protein
MLRMKLRAVNYARKVFAVAQGYAQTPEGDVIRTHVEQMKLARRRARRKKAEGDVTRTDK